VAFAQLPQQIRHGWTVRQLFRTPRQHADVTAFVISPTVGGAGCSLRGSVVGIIMIRMLVSRFEWLPHVSAPSLLILVSLGASPAAAQFVCESTAGGADGAAAQGGGTVVCGTSAGAGSSGGNFNNSAFGASAGAAVTGRDNTAVGSLAGFSVTGNGNSGFGSSAGIHVTGNNNVAFGSGAGRAVAGSNNVAIGNGAGSGGVFPAVVPLNVSDTVAIGNAATARAEGAVAIGSGAQATRANQFALGTAANTYTAAGITSAASRAAQSGPTQFVTTDASGNLAAASVADLGFATTGDLAAINARLNDLDSRTSKALTGVAMAFAMAGVPNLMPNERFAVTANFGTYEGRNGTAFNAAVRLSEQAQLTGGVAVGINDSVVGGRVGLRLGW